MNAKSMINDGAFYRSAYTKLNHHKYSQFTKFNRLLQRGLLEKMDNAPVVLISAGIGMRHDSNNHEEYICSARKRNSHKGNPDQLLWARPKFLQQGKVLCPNNSLCHSHETASFLMVTLVRRVASFFTFAVPWLCYESPIYQIITNIW